MKKFMLQFALVLGVNFFARAQTTVEAIEVMGDTYTVYKDFPTEIIG